MKNATLKSTLAAALAVVAAVGASSQAAASEKKHGYHAPGHYRPYVAPAPVYVNHGYRHHGYRHNGDRHHGHSRWIAPVAVAATIGAIAYASQPHYYNPPVTYAAPSYYAPTYYNAPVYDAFTAVDHNRDGFLTFHEARGNDYYYRNFGRIDWNRDGYISRDEVEAFQRR
jgi:hypothetical protein